MSTLVRILGHFISESEKKRSAGQLNSACAFVTIFISFKLKNIGLRVSKTKQMKCKAHLYNVVKLRCCW